MAELSSEDRNWLEKVDSLRDLQKHPGWKVYEDEILSIAEHDIRDLLLNGATGGTLSPAEEVGLMRGLRIILKTLVRIRTRPAELITIGRRVREEFGVPTSEEDE